MIAIIVASFASPMLPRDDDDHEDNDEDEDCDDKCYRSIVCLTNAAS